MQNLIKIERHHQQESYQLTYPLNINPYYYCFPTQSIVSTLDVETQE